MLDGHSCTCDFKSHGPEAAYLKAESRKIGVCPVDVKPSRHPEPPRNSWRDLCALGFARSACLNAGGVVGVAALVFDRAEHPER